MFTEDPTRKGIPSITKRGEVVRSRSERKIADYFYENRIEYDYEKPVNIKGHSGWKIINPDFYLPEYNVYVEFWGWADEDKKYNQNMKWKMKQYYDNGINFISIYPRNLKDLDRIFKQKFIKVTGKELTSLRYCTSCGRKTISPRNKFCRICGKKQ